MLSVKYDITEIIKEVNSNGKLSIKDPKDIKQEDYMPL